MTIPIIITSKSTAILDLIKLQDDFLAKGATLHNIETYSFVALLNNQSVKVYWSGIYIESEILINY